MKEQLKEKTNSHAKENYNKSGKLAKRRETRRLEAIGRQIDRIEKAKKNAAKAKNKKDAQKKIDHAELTLQLVRGGHPESEIRAKFKAAKAVVVADEAAK
jgi:hypothetical protein